MDVLEKGLRFQGEAVWWLPRALPPSSQGRDPWSRGGRHTWLPAGGAAERKEGESSPRPWGPPGRSSPNPGLSVREMPKAGGPGCRPAPSNPGGATGTLSRTHFTPVSHTNHPCLPHKCPIQARRTKGLCLAPRRCCHGVAYWPPQKHLLNHIP